MAIMEAIKTKKEYQMAMDEIEIYLANGFDNLTEAEDGILEIISKRVSEYEKIHYPMPVTFV